MLLPLHNDTVIRLACEGEIGHLFKPDEEPVRALLGPSCYSLPVLLDLERAQSLDTSGIAWLVNIARRFLRGGGTLVLYSVPPLIQQVLAFVQMTDLVPVAAHEQQARQSVFALRPSTPRSE
jgi:anti-anti-sigma factor